jgi:serine/threonine-protein kinase
MDPRRWERIQVLFQQAVELPEPQRSSFLETATAADQQLLIDIKSLLNSDKRPTSLLDQTIAQVAAPMFNPSSHLISQEFGPYQVRELLGEGGMATVYLAERVDLGSLAAIKVLRDAWMSPARRQRFDAEERTLAQLTHPSIARLYDADTLADGTPWFAMEYVKGVPLTDYCRQHQSSLADRLRLLKSVCQAVRYAHSRAIIHRDLKPSNILVQSDGTIKLLDFGIAKQIDQNDQPLNPTLTGLRMMTPAYAAPEQIRGEQLGTYTDLYALGVILYELLTGRLPFDLSNRSPTEAEQMILHQEPAKPSVVAKIAFPKALWADLDVLCLTALHKDPERRYASVDALTRDIDHYLASEPLEARGDTFRYRLGKFIQRNKRRVIAAALTLACLSALVIFYTIRLRTARNVALAEAARTQRVLRFTLNLFNGGDLQVGPATNLRVTTLIDRGAQEAANLNSDPAVQAEMYETLGEVYQKLGILDRADTLLTKALRQRRSLLGAIDRSEVAASLISLGLLRSDQAKFDDAERLIRQALQIDRASLPPGDPAIATALQALGKVLEDRGSYKEAIQVFKEAVRLRSKPSADKADLAASQIELANTYFYNNQYDEAESLYQTLLPTYRQLFGEHHPMVAEDLINLGAVQQQRGRYKDAETFHRQALEIMQAFYGPHHFKTAASLTLVARALEYQNRYDEAVGMLKRALAIQERVFGQVHPNVASALNELGNIAVKRGNYDEAENDFERLVEIYRACYQGKHYRIGIALANLGGVYLARKDNVHAEQLFLQALAMYAQTLPPGNLDEGITRIKLGRALLRQNRFPDAHAQTLAGYQIVSARQSPTVTYLENARQDLAEESAANKK